MGALCSMSIRCRVQSSPTHSPFCSWLCIESKLLFLYCSVVAFLQLRYLTGFLPAQDALSIGQPVPGSLLTFCFLRSEFKEKAGTVLNRIFCLSETYEESLHQCNNYNLGFCRLKSCRCADTPAETVDSFGPLHAKHRAWLDQEQ